MTKAIILYYIKYGVLIIWSIGLVKEVHRVESSMHSYDAFCVYELVLRAL